MKILFFGDSITDAARNRNPEDRAKQSALGVGYVRSIGDGEGGAFMAIVLEKEIYD